MVRAAESDGLVVEYGTVPGTATPSGYRGNAVLG